MRKLLALILSLMLISACALAEGGLTMIIDTDEGSMLISEDGSPLTQAGEYDVIYSITYEECPPERLLYAVTPHAEYELITLSPEDLENMDIEAWPEDGGELVDGEDSEIVDDEWGTESGDDLDIEIIVGEEEYIGDWDEDWSEEDWYDFEGDFFDSLYAVMNAKGEVITEYDYIAFTHDVANAVVFGTRADGLIDVIDEAGNVLLSTDYAAMTSDCSGGYFATKPDLDRIDEYGEFPTVSELVHVTSDGAEEATGYSTGTYELGIFDSGFLCVALYIEPMSEIAEIGDVDMEDYPEKEVDEDMTEAPEDAVDEDFIDYYDSDDYYEAEGYVYLDAQGKNVFGKEFTYATMFTGGYAEVEDEDYNTRLINTSGEFVTEGDYSSFDRVDGDMPIVANYYEGGFDLLSQTDLSVIASFGNEYGEELFAAHAGDGFILAYSDSTMLIMDKTGNVLYTSDAADEDVYAYTWYAYCEGSPERIIVSRGAWPEAECSLMDLSGNTIGASYPELVALSWKDGQGRYLVSTFDVVEEEYDGETYLDADYESYLYGVIDQDGNTILETVYPMINCVSANRYWVFDGENYQLMDESGNVLYQPE